MDATPTSSGEDDELKPSLKKLGGAALGLLHGHIELVGIEFQEEKSRTFQLFIFSALALFFGLLITMGISAAIMIACWENHRLAAIVGLCLFYGIALLLSIGKAIQLVRKGETPFHATLEELNRNRERLLP
jgi:uncharacterized membrane protein YqjE